MPPTNSGGAVPTGTCASGKRRILAVDPGDPEDICGTGGPERDPGCDDDPLTDLGDLLAMGHPRCFLHHVGKTLDVTSVYAMRTPQNGETARSAEARR